jgi:hypothetical protein
VTLQLFIKRSHYLAEVEEVLRSLNPPTKKIMKSLVDLWEFYEAKLSATVRSSKSSDREFARGNM